jgi:hypothetical protein
MNVTKPGQNKTDSFPATKASCSSAEGWFLGGNGGNATVVLPALDAVVVITRTNYNTRGMHQQTNKLVDDQASEIRPVLGHDINMVGYVRTAT